MWVTSWPYAEWVKHAWAGAWMCSIFRNESRMLASVQIRQAVAATRWYFGEPPELGMVTFVDERRVKAKDIMGRCFVEAGFTRLDVRTKDEQLLVFQILAAAMPDPCPPIGAQLRMEQA